MKKIFITLVGMFIANEIARVFTGWANVDWMNLTGFILVICIALVMGKDCEE